jgi:hypothetical protein
MIIKLDHIGITVSSVKVASKELNPFQLFHHLQSNVGVPACVNEVATGDKSFLSIALHYEKSSIGIELIEYDQSYDAPNSVFAWSFDPDCLSAASKCIAPLDKSRSSLANVIQLKAEKKPLNGVIVMTKNISMEYSFWGKLGFKLVIAQDDFYLLCMTEKLIPFNKYYIMICKCADDVHRNTDFLGLNEIAFFCTSIQSIVQQINGSAMRTTVSTAIINGKALDICFLRSPAGVLVELFALARD